jgi:cobalt/nickel transport system permease protein
MFSIDRHAWTNRWSSHHPAEKVLLACGGLILSLLLPSISGGMLVLATMSALILIGARIPWRAYFAFMLVPALFLLPGALTVALRVEFVPFSIHLAERGLVRSGEIGCRSLAGLSCLAMLTLTTPLTDILPRLRRLRVPDAVLEVVLLMYRLAFLAAEVALNGYRAQSMRSGYQRWRMSLHSAGMLAGTLLFATFVRARRLAIGLEARNHSGRMTLLPRPTPLSHRRVAYSALLLLALAVAAHWLQHRAHWWMTHA